MTELSKTPLLDQIASPQDLRKLDKTQLPTLAEELRRDLIDVVSQTGGHFGAGLGVVELTTAIHYVFNTPEDRVIWDVGHQAYPHKILTGRRRRMRSIRKGGGLSGFTKRSESAFDPFGAAHSSTSISSGLGMAVARDLAGKRNHIIAVIGDGAMSAGMAYEAINNAGALKSKLIIILNDNAMSIAPPVGASSDYFARLASSKQHHELRVAIDSHLDERLDQARARGERQARGLLGGGNWFDEMGLLYLGPLNGHDLDHLVPVLEAVRDSETIGPVLIHVLTEKGHGYAPAAGSPDKGHAVGKFDVATGAQVKAKASAPTYTKVFAEALIKEAERDPKIVAITAAMPSGTGLDLFEKKFPDRMFDVGIAEQHAVTFAAGLASEGFRPFCAIYSTFLQRAYDQVVHDVAIQHLPVRFAMDRAGLVGADGATHAGSFDLSYLCCLPGFVVMAAADEAELVHMVATAAAYDEGPIALRYPRGEATGVALPERGEVLAIGKGRILREGGDVAILSLGTRLAEALAAAELLESDGIACTVADARFAKPIDEELIARLVRRHRLLVTVEEGAIGGFSAQVLSFVANAGLMRPGFEIRTMTLPDVFIDHDDMVRQYDQAGLNAADIARLIAGRVMTRAAAGA